MNLQELNKLYMVLLEAEKINLDKSVRKKFNVKLITYLKEQFGDDITFSIEDTYGYITATYKGVGIEIRTIRGMALSIQDNQNAYLLEEFKDIFSEIVGMEPICSYNFCYQVDSENFVYYTTEWNKEPNARLESLVMQAGNPMNHTVKNFNDYYLCSVIKGLGNELFSEDGYAKVFDTSHSNRALDRHRLQQIQKVYPEINTNSLNTWYANNKREAERQYGLYRNRT